MTRLSGPEEEGKGSPEDYSDHSIVVDSERDVAFIGGK